MKFSQPANLTTYTTWSLFSLQVESSRRLHLVHHVNLQLATASVIIISRTPVLLLGNRWRWSRQTTRNGSWVASRSVCLHVCLSVCLCVCHCYLLLSELHTDEIDFHDLFFHIICKPDSCLHHLLPPSLDTSVISRLRSSLSLPHPISQTKKFQSFLNFAHSSFSYLLLLCYCYCCHCLYLHLFRIFYR